MLTEIQKRSCSHHVSLREWKLWKLINFITRSLGQAEPHLRQKCLPGIPRRSMWRENHSLGSLKFFHTRVSTCWALVEAEIGECSRVWFMQISATHCLKPFRHSKLLFFFFIPPTSISILMSHLECWHTKGTQKPLEPRLTVKMFGVCVNDCRMGTL